MDASRQNALYTDASAAFGAPLQRLARAYEGDPDKQQDLLQEIHLEIWRSLANFDGRCSLRTWVYRVAHNVGASHVLRSRRAWAGLVDLENLETSQFRVDPGAEANHCLSAGMLFDLTYRLRPLDRQVILLYLEGETAADIAEASGLSATNVATRIHRIKRLLNQRDTEGIPNATR